MARPGGKRKRGDVVWVPFTYSDFSGGKARPAVIVSTPDFGVCAGDYVLAAVTGQVQAHGGHPTCWELQDVKGTGLAAASVVTSHLLTLAPERVGARAGRLSPDDLAQVEIRWRRALGL